MDCYLCYLVVVGAGVVPAGEDGGIYDVQEGMNVALPSDGADTVAGDDWSTGQTAHGAAMEHEYGAPIEEPPGQQSDSPRPVWDHTETGRREMESLGESLAERVIGQEAAVDMVATTMQMCYVGLQPSNGPLGVFLFVGPSGVGKTELAKALAAQLFGKQHRY